MVELTRLFVLFLCACPCIILTHKVLDEVPLIDGHNDLPYNLYTLVRNNLSEFDFTANLTNHPVWGVKNCKSCFTDLPRLRKGQVGAQFFVAYVSCSTQYKDSLAKTLEQIDVIKRLVHKYPADLQFVTTADDIMDAFSKKKIASLIGVEGGHSMDSRLGVLRMLYDLGVRYMTLTHTCNTPWADNSYIDLANPFHNLTDFGKLVVKEMNRLGMMIDVSHVSHQVMNDAILTSRAPVIFSHSSVYSVYNHHRNVPDDTLKLVEKHKGVVMVNFYPGFISPTPKTASIHDVAKHINYIAKFIGVDYVGIGGDYDGVSSMPIGLEDVSKYPDLFDLLQKENATRWTDENLKKLASGNLIRAFKEVERVRDSLKNEIPQETWISISDLNNVEEDVEQLWKCRTLLNNTSLTPSPRSSTNSLFKRTYMSLLMAVLFCFLL